jgi:large subunit ribosomal protein L23
MSKTMLLKPRISEKAYGIAQTKNVYVFQVPVDVGKLEVAQAVTAQFDVHVLEVNILNVKGKVKRTVRRGGRPIMGKRADFKKAYVTIKAGQTIPIFAAEDEKPAEKPAATKKGKK